VQAFIKQARKTQDLYVGSQLLSDLVKAGAKEFTNNQNGTLIFPVTGAETFTNRFLGEIEGEKTDAELQKIGEAVKNAIRNYLTNIAEQSVKKVIGDKNLPIGFNEQINQLLDVKWAFTEWDDTKISYKDAYSEIEKIIGAIKNVRTFKQFDYQGKKGEQGRKCSLCGERNVKFFKANYKNDKKNIPAFIHEKETVEILREKPILTKGEGLCAVCATKRFKIESFPSTAEIALKTALLNGLDCCEDEILKFRKLFNLHDNDFLQQIVISDFVSKEGKLLMIDEHFDFQYFYEENHIQIENEEIRIKATEQHKILKKCFSKNKISFDKYYSILVFDGDSMGEWLSGENLVDKDKLYEFHEALSGCLSNFTKEVEKILEEKRGKAVYSGGDDFMGFVNLNHLFDVIKEIYELFDKLVNNELAKNESFKIKENKKLTLSAGVAIAHYKTPLGIALEKAREMEKLAKKDETNGSKKDAFAIAVLKRSGEINQTVWKWKQGEIFTTEIIKNLVSELQNENGLSNKFIKNTQIEFSLLSNEKGNLSVENKVFNAEFERLLKKSGGSETTQNLLKPLLPKEKQEDFKLENFFMALNVADFIQRNTNETKAEENGK
jgi:CRISPR-associated protein Cmr2